jgi:hypothetical protein
MELTVMRMKMVLFCLAVLLASVTRAIEYGGVGRIEEQDRLVDHRFQVLAALTFPAVAGTEANK